MYKHYTITVNNIFVVNGGLIIKTVYVYFQLSFLEYSETLGIFWIFACQTMKGGWFFLAKFEFNSSLYNKYTDNNSFNA